MILIHCQEAEHRLGTTIGSLPSSKAYLYRVVGAHLDGKTGTFFRCAYCTLSDVFLVASSDART